MLLWHKRWYHRVADDDVERKSVAPKEVPEADDDEMKSCAVKYLSR